MKKWTLKNEQYI